MTVQNFADILKKKKDFMHSHVLIIKTEKFFTMQAVFKVGTELIDCTTMLVA